MKFLKPIVFFDLETTGVDTMKDRIVQIATVKLFPDGTRENKEYLINPTIPIPEGASEVHGITDEMVKDKPVFDHYAKNLNKYLEGCDLGGYNSNQFDVPLLIEEFRRSGIEFDTDNRSYVDVMQIERKLNPNTLEAVYKRYMGKEIENAHDASADTFATVDVVLKQIENIDVEEGADLAEALDTFAQGDEKRVDIAGKLCEIDGEICWTFGKHKGEPVKNTSSYAAWFLRQSVPKQTADIIRNTLKV